MEEGQNQTNPYSELAHDGQKLDDDSQLTTFQNSSSESAVNPLCEDIVEEDVRFFNIVTSGIYRDFVTESCQDELDCINNEQSEERYAKKRRQQTSSAMPIKCFVSDSSFSCTNIPSDMSHSCYSCKMRIVCFECYTKCRRCNFCYLAVNRKSGLSDLTAANGNNDPITDDLFMLRSELRRLSVEENLFCSHKLRCHKLFAEHSSFTGQVGRHSASLMAHNGYFFVDFAECVANHPDARVVRLVPLFIAEQLQIGIYRHKCSLVPYNTNLRFSGRTIATVLSPGYFDDIFSNFKFMIIATGIIPGEGTGIVACNGRTECFDLLCTPPGATCEENHMDFPEQCKKCRMYEPDDQFMGCTMLVNCSDKLICLGVGQPTDSQEADYGVDIEPASCLFLMAPFQYFGFANVESVPHYLYRLFWEKKLGMRKKIGSATLFVPEDCDEDD